MCILSNRGIGEWIESGELEINPFDPKDLGSDSLDLHLSGRFRVIENRGAVECIDLAQEDGVKYVDIEVEEYVIHPGEVIVGYAREWIQLPPNLTGRVDGRSKFAQRGLQVESAGLVHRNWKGYLALELVNLGGIPIKVGRGLPVCQISFYTVSSPAELEK